MVQYIFMQYDSLFPKSLYSSELYQLKSKRSAVLHRHWTMNRTPWMA